jgi:DNA-binding SARP family transcriptional activator
MRESAKIHLPTQRREPDTLPPVASGDICLRLLPQFSLEVRGQPRPVCSRAERVLVLLAVNGGTAKRGTVAGTLWPETTSERALSSLRTALWSLNRLHLPLVHVSPTTVSLGSDVQADLQIAMDLARELIDGRNPLLDVPETLRLLRRELLSDWAEDWILIEQERFRQLRLHGLEALSELLISNGRHAQAVVAGLEVIACDPLRESAHRLLMTAYLAEGNRKEAISQYRLCARLLRDELDLEPSREMNSLLRQATSHTMHDDEVTVA